MICWDILGIDASIDVSIIKKAYAKKIKIYHPEEDPKGFQMLREAYDQALKYAKQKEIGKELLRSAEEINIYSHKTNHEINVLTETNYLEEESQDNTFHFLNEFVNVYSHKTNHELVDEYFEKVDCLYSDFFSRIDASKWDNLLNEEIMWNLDYKELLSHRFLEFLLEDHYIPNYIWKKLNLIFKWSEQEDYLNTYCSKAFIQYFFKQISDDMVPRYCYFDNNLDVDYAEYISLREKAVLSLIEGDLIKADNNLSLALNLFSLDPDIYCLRAEFYLKSCNLYRANYEFKNAIHINSNDKYLYLYQTTILYEHRRYSQSIQVCKFIQRRFGKSSEVDRIVGICYFNMYKFQKASKIFIPILQIEPSNKEIRNYLIEISKKIRYRSLVLNKKRKLVKIYKILGETEKIEELRKPKIGKKYILLIICLAILFFGVIAWISDVSPTVIQHVDFIFHFVRYLLIPMLVLRYIIIKFNKNK